jgi:hypothetical protein
MPVGADAAVVVGVHLAGDAVALRRSLPTAVHQHGVGRLRVVVVDDAADGEARAALDELTRWYPDVEVVRWAEGRGRAAARNHVLDQAADDAVLAWLDLGDVWHPRKLAVQLATLRAADETDTLLVTSTHRLVDPVAATDRVVVPDTRGDLRARLLDRDLDVPFGTVLGTVVAHRILGGFDPTLPYRDDEELLLRFLETGGGFLVPRSGPLSTGPEARDHPSARDVLLAERRFRRVHGARMRALDPSGTRRRHRRELQRSARLYAKAGQPGRARVQRLRADATAALDRLARTVARDGPARPERDVPSHQHAGPTVAPATGAAATDPPVPDPLRPVHAAAGANDWEGVLAAWTTADDRTRAEADPITRELVARSLRALDRHHEAIEVARAGLERWPSHPRIELELAKSRTAITDWSCIWHPVDVGTAAHEAGEVVSLGALAGHAGVVHGRVAAAPGPLTPEVALRVGGTTVATTATTTDGRFSLSCEQLLEFVGDDDVLTVEVDGTPLPLPELGPAAQARTGWPSRLPALRERLDAGAVFTKFGQLRPGYTPARKRRTLDLVDEVAAVVVDVTGRGCTPFYGNLLGAVREQDLIAHDVGGFDVGFVATAVESERVRAEVLEVARALLEQGFHLEVEPFGLLVRRAPGDRIFVDVNYAWSRPDGTLGFSYGWRHEPPARAERFVAPRDTFLAGRLVTIPGDAEAVLHQVYGPGWSVPDQGFEVTAELRRDEGFLLTEDERAQLRAAAPDRVTLL